VSQLNYNSLTICAHVIQGLSSARNTQNESTQFTQQQVLYLLILLKVLKFTLKYTIISLLHVSVFNDHPQRALSVPN